MCVNLMKDVFSPDTVHQAPQNLMSLDLNDDLQQELCNLVNTALAEVKLAQSMRSWENTYSSHNHILSTWVVITLAKGRNFFCNYKSARDL